MSFPALCVVAQGSKEILLGDNRYRYDPAHYLITTAELPIASRITEASPERPYLRVCSSSTRPWSARCWSRPGSSCRAATSAVPAINVSPLDADLLDAVVRLVRLVDAPAEARVLAPLITREIVVRLLLGAQGGRLRQLAVLGGDPHRIAAAVARLRKDFDQPLRIEDLAREVGMSVSRFHHHFRAVTALSPLQFQKQLRLQEARRLMLGEGLDAASAGARVGYGNASHFTREYKRLFGAPPMRDVERLRHGRQGTCRALSCAKDELATSRCRAMRQNAHTAPPPPSRTPAARTRGFPARTPTSSRPAKARRGRSPGRPHTPGERHQHPRTSPRRGARGHNSQRRSGRAPRSPWRAIAQSATAPHQCLELTAQRANPAQRPVQRDQFNLPVSAALHEQVAPMTVKMDKRLR